MGVPCRPSSVDVSHIAIVSPAHLGLRARPSTEERTAPTQRTGRARGCQIKIRRRGTGCTMWGSKQESRRLPSTPQLDSASIRSFQWFSWRGRGGQRHPTPRHFTDRIHTQYSVFCVLHSWNSLTSFRRTADRVPDRIATPLTVSIHSKAISDPAAGYWQQHTLETLNRDSWGGAGQRPGPCSCRYPCRGGLPALLRPLFRILYFFSRRPRPLSPKGALGLSEACVSSCLPRTRTRADFTA